MNLLVHNAEVLIYLQGNCLFQQSRGQRSGSIFRDVIVQQKPDWTTHVSKDEHQPPAIHRLHLLGYLSRSS